jgi:aminopeptidase N
MQPLTHAEAIERAGLVAVEHASIELDLRDEHSFRSTTTIRFTATGEAVTFADFRPRRLLTARLNDDDLDPGLLVEGRMPLSPRAGTNTLVLGGDAAYANDGEGLHCHIDPADGRRYLYAMSFLDAGPRWFAGFDQPDLKCPYTMTVRTPPGWTVLGNGRFTEVEPGLWRMVETPPLATYFVTLVAGPYASTYTEHDGIRIGVHARATLAAELATEADDIIRVTTQGFDAYHELFGERYAFGDYHQAFVPDFNAGAMENPGCVTLRDTYLYRGQATRAERAARAGTIVHELAHQWFGDLVTMRWWDDLWLNESFAEYLAHRVCAEATEYPLWVEFGLHRKDWGAIADQGPNTHPVAGNGAADTVAALAQFDGISYAKGAGVLKQLVAAITPEVFFTGLRDYIARHRFGNATFADLLAAWERAGAEGLVAWTGAWLRTQGMDMLTATRAPGGVVVTRTPGEQPADRAHSVAVALFDETGVETARTTALVTGASALDLPTAAGLHTGLIVPDAADDTWARIRPDREVGEWPAISRLADPIVRVVLWNSLRDQVRSAELDPAVALDMVTGTVPEEPDDLITRAILDWSLGILAGPYTRTDQRTERVDRLTATAASILERAEPGSDRQLSAWRSLLGCTRDAGLLRAWLDGDRLPAGRELDPELRWRAVTRLATVTGDAEAIDRAYHLDRSAFGRVHRARALASLPDPAAKAAAFTLLLQPSELSAYELYATAEGFFLPEQDALTAPYVARFFDGVNATASFRSGWSLGQLVLRAFPATATTRGTLDRAEHLLATDDLDPGVRRPLTEATDALRRAVESIEKYAGFD